MDMSLHMVLVALILLLVLILLNDTENFTNNLTQTEINEIVGGKKIVYGINEEWEQDWAAPFRESIGTIKVPVRWTRTTN